MTGAKYEVGWTPNVAAAVASLHFSGSPEISESHMRRKCNTEVRQNPSFALVTTFSIARIHGTSTHCAENVLVGR
jgi:hypothetical protein